MTFTTMIPKPALPMHPWYCSLPGSPGRRRGSIASLGSDTSDISHRAKKGSDHQQSSAAKEDRFKILPIQVRILPGLKENHKTARKKSKEKTASGKASRSLFRESAFPRQNGTVGTAGNGKRKAQWSDRGRR